MSPMGSSPHCLLCAGGNSLVFREGGKAGCSAQTFLGGALSGQVTAAGFVQELADSLVAGLTTLLILV